MKTAVTNFETPYIKADGDQIAINYNGQKHNLPIDNIANVYLKKKKRAFIPAFMNTVISLYDKRYKLYIRTDDSHEISIKVKPEEKAHFINLISHIRKAKAQKRISVA